MWGKTLLLAMTVLVSLGLSACGNEEETLSEFDKVPAGIDKNHDGIRDEVAERMHKEFAESINADEMRIMEEHAKVFQEIMTLDMNDRNAVLITRDHFDLVMNCAVYVFGDDLDYDTYTILLTRLRQWYFNTKARREIRQEFILRSKEYHFQSDNFNGINTCGFEFSDETKKMIEIRRGIAARKKAKEEQLAAPKEAEVKSQEKQERTQQVEVEKAK